VYSQQEFAATAMGHVSMPAFLVFVWAYQRNMYEPRLGEPSMPSNTEPQWCAE
jgi:hypothetical protein